MTCIFCGCTDLDACPGGCAWAAPRLPICSACVELLRYAIGVGHDRKVRKTRLARATKKRKRRQASLLVEERR
jgi:hypothetical protein